MILRREGQGGKEGSISERVVGWLVTELSPKALFFTRVQLGASGCAPGPVLMVETSINSVDPLTLESQLSKHGLDGLDGLSMVSHES